MELLNNRLNCIKKPRGDQWLMLAGAKLAINNNSSHIDRIANDHHYSPGCPGLSKSGFDLPVIKALGDAMGRFFIFNGDEYFFYHLSGFNIRNKPSIMTLVSIRCSPHCAASLTRFTLSSPSEPGHNHSAVILNDCALYMPKQLSGGVCGIIVKQIRLKNTFYTSRANRRSSDGVSHFQPE